MSSKAETYRSRDEQGDKAALIEAALDTESVVINGNLFELKPSSPYEFIYGIQKTIQKAAPGDVVLFTYDDGSCLEITWARIEELQAVYVKSGWLER